MDNTNVCRLCFVSGNETIEIFGEEGIKLHIIDIVHNHFWFKIESNDNLPMDICRNCWKHVNEFHEFYENIGNIHESLQYNDNIKQLQTTADGTINHTDSIIDMDHIDDERNVKIDEHNDDLLIESESINFLFKNTVKENDINHFNIEDIELETILNLDTEYKINDTTVTHVNNIDSEICSLSNDIVNNKHDIYRKETYNTRSMAKSPDSVAKKRKRKSVSDRTWPVTNEDTTSNLSIEVDDIEHKRNYIKNDNLLITSMEEEDNKIREFYNLNCQKCSVKLSTITEIKAHYKDKHKLKNGHVLCCNKKLFNRSNLLSHMRLHTNPNEFQCHICNKNYKNQLRLNIHFNVHATPAERKYICDICGNSYTIRYLLLRHFRDKHITKPKKEFKCDQCDKCFKENSILQSHIRGVHQFKNVHICHICAKVYKSKAQCELHYLEHTNVNNSKVQCQICGALLKNVLSLNCHLRRTHNGVPCKCKLCGKIAPHKDALQSHMRAVHAERKYKCNLCSKAFKRPIGLKEHMASHTGSSILYTCPHCPQTFNSNANMHSHRKRKHPTEWLQMRSKISGIVKINNSTL